MARRAKSRATATAAIFQYLFSDSEYLSEVEEYDKTTLLYV